MTSCRYCKQEVTESETAVTNAYWFNTPDVCHKSCKNKGVKQEAYDCQLIDSDCNDCKYFKRGKIAEKIISKLITRDGRIELVIHRPDIFDGTCLKFNSPTNGQPNKWTGMKCFEHRRNTSPPWTTS